MTGRGIWITASMPWNQLGLFSKRSNHLSLTKQLQSLGGIAKLLLIWLVALAKTLIRLCQEGKRLKASRAMTRWVLLVPKSLGHWPGLKPLQHKETPCSRRKLRHHEVRLLDNLRGMAYHKIHSICTKTLTPLINISVPPLAPRNPPPISHHSDRIHYLI